MTTEELKQQYTELYEHMAVSRKPEYMKAFGKVMTEMFDWFSVNKREAAEEWLMKLESIKWDNYLTPAEAEKIVAGMKPKAPWGMDAWKAEMEAHGLQMEDAPCYNKCALYATMNMVMSDSADTLKKYVNDENMFDAVFDLAIDKLDDTDKKFNVRKYFGV